MINLGFEGVTEMIRSAGRALRLARRKCSVSGGHYCIPGPLYFQLGPSPRTELEPYLYPGVFSVPWSSWWPLPSWVLRALGSGARRSAHQTASWSNDFTCVQRPATSGVEAPWFSFSPASRVLIEIWRDSLVPFELKPSNITSMLSISQFLDSRWHSGRHEGLCVGDKGLPRINIEDGPCIVSHRPPTR